MYHPPFSFLPPNVPIWLAGKLHGTGHFVSALFPSLREDLWQAELDLSAMNYASLCFAVGICNAVAMGALLAFLGLVLRNSLLFMLSLPLALVIFFVTFVTLIYYPKVIASRRSRELERELIPALQQMLIEIKSGVTLFNAMASVSQDYGEVSKEFKKIVVKMNAGEPELDALSEVTEANPSKSFKKVLWQVSNALKVGSDLSGVLDNQVKSLTRERVDQIRRYGQELSPWTMMYMMVAVILPSIGVAMMIVIVGFMNVAMPKAVLYGILLFLAGFQLFFMNLVASRRPAV